MRTIQLSCNLPREAQLALGYLSMWGLDFYDNVSIHPEGIGNPTGKNLIAYFRNTEKDASYVIGAIWNEERQGYSYHS